ncbi:MAG: alpha-galactosidase [Chloroflexota bacterium]
MSRRYNYTVSYSSSFRKRRNRARWRLVLVSFGLLLALIVGAVMLLGSWPQSLGKASFAAFPDGSVLNKNNPSSNQAESLANLPPISPVALTSQKWNWPINVYSPEAFKRVWQYNDSPVQARQVARSWAYGSTPFASFLEQYKDTPQGLRLVQYWDKTRLEITDPSTPSDAPDYVTPGLLVKELMSGQMQIGEKSYMSLGPAMLPLVSDLQNSSNSTLTYAMLAQVASLKNNNRVEAQLESTVTATLDKNGSTLKDPNLAHYQIKNSYYSPELGHNVPNVFWDFLNSNGTAFVDGKYQVARLYDWQAVAGLPLTEAYWTRALVNGKSQDVLIQAFERRVLLYTPANDLGFQVEWGNVGQHYFRWRYPDVDFASLKSSLASTSSPNLPSGVNAASSGTKLTDTLEIRLVVGNASLARTLTIQNGRVTHSGLVNRQTRQAYANADGMGVNGGFLLKLDGSSGVTETITGDQFTITGFSMLTTSENESQLVLNGSVLFRGQTLNAKFYWKAIFGRNYIEKWVAIEPQPTLAGWRIRFATIEDLPLNEGLRAAPLTPEQDKLPLLIPTQRNLNVPGGAIFTHVMVQDNQSEGFYFFSATPLGGEYALDKRVVIFQEEYQDLKDGFNSGKAILGSYTGVVDLGFKRYTEYLQNYYSQMSGKRQPVWYHSWYPFTNEINQDVLLSQLEIMKTMGIYDVLHIDAGWEGSYPLEIDSKKFPQGFNPLIDKAATGNPKIGLGIWINPFSDSYGQYVNYAGMHRDHPEWHVPGLQRRDPKNNYETGPFAINSDYYFYVREKLLTLVKTYNIKAIYWDGADWNIPDASAPGLTEAQRNIARVQGLKRLMDLMNEIHKIAPDIIVVSWNSTADVHLLGSVEQLQLSDVWALPLGESELFREQQFYASTYHLPYYSIWGDWYAISYKENKDENLKQPVDLLKYAETRMVGVGGIVAGASLDLTKTPAELLNHLKKLYTWRKNFEQYFTVYQHVLEIPERNKLQVTGEAHIVKGAGFILLDNPTTTSLPVILPLSLPELELDPSKLYSLYDWSNLETATLLGKARPGEGFPITVPPRSVYIIGINLPSFAAATTSGQ